MFQIMPPVIVAVFAWWFSTGAVLYADGLPPRHFRLIMAAATGLLVAALGGLARFAWDNSTSGAYLSFGCALTAWAWQEISFYTGFVTGPRPVPCPATARAGERFVRALGCSLYHELAAIVTAGIIVALTWKAPNQTGTWTFLLLWVMHESARINVLLGVRNLNEEFLPQHMAFLRSYMVRGPVNRLFPISVALSTSITVLLAAWPGGGTGRFLLATMMAVATLEHWFLVLPMPIRPLWEWSLRSGRAPAKLQFGELKAASCLGPAERSRS